MSAAPTAATAAGTAARLGRDPAALASLAVLAAIALAAVAAPWIGTALRLDPDSVDLFARLAPPSAAHPLGTDALGRDTLMRLLHGGRVSLAVGLVGAGLAAVIGTAVGLVAGYAGGRTDAALMRLTDGVIALPLLPLLIVLAATDLGKLGLPETGATAVGRLIAIVALFGWTTVARLVRAATLTLRRRDFVLAAVAAGGTRLQILAQEILPNVVSPILVATTLSVGNVILLESVLSFLGLGIQPPMASWGNMLTNAQELVWQAPLQALWPGLAIFLTVVAFNLLGDSLQAALRADRV